MSKLSSWGLFFLMLLHGSLYADEINLAVASNFKLALQKLAADFKKNSGHDIRISSGSSGKLFAQIYYGAPYDIFLSADESRPDLLVKQGRADTGSSYVYALGKLVLLSNSDQFESCEEILYSKDLTRLAIANPKIAPYGLAAKQVLQKMGVWPQLKKQLVMGENVAQTLQFISTGNAQAGFVARSLVHDEMLEANNMSAVACAWVVPGNMYQPVKQKLVVLDAAKHKPAVQAFIRYIKSAEARKIIEMLGYDVL